MSAYVVVDSSVAYKWWYRQDEPGADLADALLEDHLAGRVMIAAPTTLPVELANALRYSRMPMEHVYEIIGLIGDAHIHLFYPQTADLQEATELAVRHGMTVYDALFLQLAEKLRCPLVTSDRRAFAGVETPGDVRLI